MTTPKPTKYRTIFAIVMSTPMDQKPSLRDAMVRYRASLPTEEAAAFDAPIALLEYSIWSRPYWIWDEVSAEIAATRRKMILATDSKVVIAPRVEERLVAGFLESAVYISSPCYKNNSSSIAML